MPAPCRHRLSMRNQRLVAGGTRSAEAIRSKAEPTIEVLLKLPQVTARCDSEGMQATVTMRGDRMIDVECGNRKDELYGVAVDLGTTTIAAVLVDNAHGGRRIAKTGRLNPKRAMVSI